MTEISQLIDHMVNLTKALKDEIKNKQTNEVIVRIYNEFNSSLVKKLNFETFVDTYAQTIIYGLFSAQLIENEKITLEKVGTIIGKTNPFLEKTFIVFNKEVTLIINLETIGINEFLRYLNRYDLKTLITEFFKDRKIANPLIHLYGLFLSKYDPRKQIERGVYYTPDPIVSFISKSVDLLLKKHLKLKSGLNDPSAVILDPAMGTGTFLNGIIKVVKDTFDKDKENLSQESRLTEWRHYISSDLLNRIFGFEIMINPYIIAHLQLFLLLEATGFNSKKNGKRIGVFLTNTLEGTHRNQPDLTEYLEKKPILDEETYSVNEIKINKPISVVIGNPPYSKFSSNRECTWIEGLMKGTISDGTRRSSYYEVDEKPLQERKTHLLDDYVKFIRFAQWRIEKTGYGIVAFITNHGFLSNPTFRGMRQQLLKAFNVIYILDLHGNILKGEKTPDNLKDENIFDIKQGTSIIFMIKEKKEGNTSRIFHSDLWGTRIQKYEYLSENNVTSVNWNQIYPISPNYFFYPIDWTLWKEYNKGWKLTDIFTEYGVGLVTARDKLTIHSSKEEVWNTISDFATLSPTEAREKYQLKNDSESWSVEGAQKDLANTGINDIISRNKSTFEVIDKIKADYIKKEFIKPVLYRPFNKKFIFYTGRSNGIIARPVYSIMKHMLQEGNISLISTRLTKGEDFKHVFVSSILFEQIFLSSKTSNSAYCFPLYLKTTNDWKKKTNLSNELIQCLSNSWNLNFTINSDFEGNLEENFSPKDIFYYIYAILHSEIYRKRYNHFLSLDFPIIPFFTNLELVRKLINKGKELIELHLIDVMGDKTLKNKKQVSIKVITSKSSNEVVKNKGKKKYTNGRLFLNDDCFIDGISEKVFRFHVGGYPILEKWIRENSNEIITAEKMITLTNMIIIIENTISISNEVDKLLKSENSFITINNVLKTP